MTKQIEDRVLYKGQEYILAGLKGAGLFTPLEFGISSEMMGIMTACYRRYFCTYECIDNQLFLVELVLVHHQRDDVELPAIESVHPKSVPPDSDFILFNCYQELKIPCSFSGGLILVRNPVDKDEVGYFPSPIRFEEVLEAQFEQGSLYWKIDHSAAVAGLRKRIAVLREALESKSEVSEAIKKWTSRNEKVSDTERRLYMKYVNEIGNKAIELEWSFVSDYEQQPPRW